MFLAIDLEACNKYVKGSVFSIGVVGADDNFNVLFKRDIIVNPHCKFCTNFRKPIEFSVDKEDVKSAPDLADIYDELKEMFTGDVIVMAHSANNDMFMLNMACKRAKLPPFRFEYICTQMIYSAVYDVMNGVALDKAAKDMNIEFIHHKADEDAEMALEILKECCNKLNCTYPELEKKLGIKRGKVNNYEYEPMRSLKLEKLRTKHRLENKKEQQKLRKESAKSNGVIVTVDYKTFDAIHQGGTNVVYAINDKFISLIKKGDTLYLRKDQGNKDVLKVIAEDTKNYDSFLDLYPEDNVKNESLLDFLTRFYDFYDAEEELRSGVKRIVVSKIENLETTAKDNIY